MRKAPERIIHYINTIPPELKGGVFALGNFDGVHIGHVQILRNCCLKARELGVKSGVILFNPHPIEFFNPVNYRYLTSIAERCELILNNGIDYVICLPFKNIVSLSAQEFITLYLKKILAAQIIITGYNFKFGKNRSGDNALLTKLAHKLNFRYQTIDEISYEYNNVSSTTIKQFIETGQIRNATCLLGRPFTISYQVIKNVLTPPPNQIVPLPGAYLVRYSTPVEKHLAVLYLEKNLALHSLNDPISYSNPLKIEFLSLIRPICHFTSTSAVEQLDIDLKFAQYLKNILHQDLYLNSW